MALPSVTHDRAAQENFDLIGQFFYVGSGSPEGRVQAPVGAVYHCKDGGAGTAFWVKETGGKTSAGWVAK